MRGIPPDCKEGDNLENAGKKRVPFWGQSKGHVSEVEIRLAFCYVQTVG